MCISKSNLSPVASDLNIGKLKSKHYNKVYTILHGVVISKQTEKYSKIMSSTRNEAFSVIPGVNS